MTIMLLWYYHEVNIQEEELQNKRTEAEQERLSIQQLLTTIESEKEAAEAQRLDIAEKRKELTKEEQVSENTTTDCTIRVYYSTSSSYTIL